MRAAMNKNLVFWIISLISLAGYILISYFIPRHHSLPLLSTYSLLFMGYLALYKLTRRTDLVNQAYGVAFLFRLAFLLLIPNLSDDVYRFLWDGYLVIDGYNPFQATPLSYLKDHAGTIQGIGIDLFNQFGKDTYSSYPPLNQWVFALAVRLFPHSNFGVIVFIRCILLIFEAGNLVLIIKLLKRLKMPVHTGLLYALNPLVILELSANLHFEAMMIFFMLLSFLFLLAGRLNKGAVALGLSVLSKLIPLIFLPALWIRLGWKKGLSFTILTGLVVIIAFIPFVNIDMVSGFTSSLGLYFQKFEFNASVYYLVRQLGYWITGYNIIYIAGPLLGLITLVLILYFSSTTWARNITLMETAMWILMIYVVFTTTLHPWYITTLVALSVFTRYRFPVLWSLLIFLSYEGYTQNGYRENYWLIALEYLLVYAFMIWELKKGLTDGTGRPFNPKFSLRRTLNDEE